MTVTFNHTIVYATDKRHSAEFLTHVLGLPEPRAVWSFMTVPLDHGVALDFATAERPIAPQHYAFLGGEEDFDGILARIQAQGIPYWADPDGPARSRSTTTTADVASTSRILTGISSKRSRVRTDRVLHEVLGALTGRPEHWVGQALVARRHLQLDRPERSMHSIPRAAGRGSTELVFQSFVEADTSMHTIPLLPSWSAITVSEGALLSSTTVPPAARAAAIRCSATSGAT